jgi:hypothetical protein
MYSFPVDKSPNGRAFLKNEGSSLMGMVRLSMRSGFTKDSLWECGGGDLVLFIYLNTMVFDQQCSPGIF